MFRARMVSRILKTSQSIEGAEHLSMQLSVAAARLRIPGDIRYYPGLKHQVVKFCISAGDFIPADGVGVRQ